jgi:DNA-binding NtrC family response regulator
VKPLGYSSNNNRIDKIQKKEEKGLWKKDNTTNNNNKYKTSNNNKKKRILIVDDETDVNYTFESVLEENGFMVDSFDNPVLALNDFKAGLYDLVLLDIKMPEMDGFKLYEEMGKVDNKFKVCFLTASEMFYEQYRPAHSIITGENYPVIQKPIKNEELIKEVNKILAQR